jgi:hypothetical protein
MRTNSKIMRILYLYIYGKINQNDYLYISGRTKSQEKSFFKVEIIVQNTLLLELIKLEFTPKKELHDI